MALRDRGLDRFGHRRLEPRQFGQQHVGAEQEVAGIPQIAVAHIAGGGGGVRLLDEALDGVHAVLADGLARQDVAVAGLRLGRLDAEGDDAPGLGGLAAGEAGGAELRHVEDDVVGGERQHHGVGVAFERHRGGGRDGRAESRRIGSITTVASTPTSSACRRAKKWKFGPVMTMGGANIGSCTRSRVS